MKRETRVYSRYTNEAIKLLAGRIKATRIECSITSQELSDRAGISRDLLYRIEKGDLSCSIGNIFEVASILGLQLFQSDYDDLLLKNKILDEKLALLPSKVKKSKIEVDDDF